MDEFPSYLCLTDLLDQDLSSYEYFQTLAPEVQTALRREDAARDETESFLSKVYGGSLGLMMSAMVESRQLTESDIAELSAILEQAGGEKK